MKAKAMMAVLLVALGSASSAAADEPGAAPPPPPSAPMAPLPVAPVAPVAPLPVPPPAAAAKPVEARPTGTLFILAGTGLAAGGVANLATAPLCETSRVRHSAQPACVGVSVAFGVGLLGAGVPLLVVGVRQRQALAELPRVGFVPVAGGATFTWGRSW